MKLEFLQQIFKTQEVPLREVMFGVWCAMSATKTTGKSRFTRFCFKVTWKFRPLFEFTRYFAVYAISNRRSLVALVLISRLAENDVTVTPSVTRVAWLRWWYIHSANIVPPTTALVFVTKMSEKRKSTSPSAIQVKNRPSTISIAAKLDVINHLKKGDRTFHIRYNIRFARISQRIFCDNGDIITEVAKSALVCVAWLPQSYRNASYQTVRMWFCYIFIALETNKYNVQKCMYTVYTIYTVQVRM